MRQWLGRKAPSLEVIPVINNFDEIQKRWRGEELGALLSSLGGRSALATQLSNYADAKSLGGLLIDFEGLLPEQQNGLIELTRLLTGMMHERGKRLLVFVPAGDDAYDTARLSAFADGVVLGTYDEHTEISPGPLAAQGWFNDELKKVAQLVLKKADRCDRFIRSRLG